MKKKIIAIYGKTNSGKDLVGRIIQYLTSKDKDKYNSFQEWDMYYSSLNPKTEWEIKKFAGKTNVAFKIITGIDYLSLPRNEKESVRPKFIEFAEKQKEIFGKYVWANALMEEYKPYATVHGEIYYPNWIITDLRFFVEIRVIKRMKSGGIIIRVDRKESDANPETEADKTYFDYVIDNNGTIEELIEKVREILIKENVIKA